MALYLCLVVVLLDICSHILFVVSIQIINHIILYIHTTYSIWNTSKKILQHIRVITGTCTYFTVSKKCDNREPRGVNASLFGDLATNRKCIKKVFLFSCFFVCFGSIRDNFKFLDFFQTGEKR